MRFGFCLLVLMSLNFAMLVPTCNAELTASGAYESILRGTMDTIDLVWTLAQALGRIVMNPFVLSRAMPTLRSHLPTIAGEMLANILEVIIEFGNNLVAWVEPYNGTVEISERSLNNSFIGRLLRWDILDTVFRLMRVPKHCHAKAACEAGAYVVHRNKRVAGFLKAMRSHFSRVSIHWPATMKGLRGEVCETLYPKCTQSFVMAKPRPRPQQRKDTNGQKVKNVVDNRKHHDANSRQSDVGEPRGPV